jgi:hypothetical protein
MKRALLPIVAAVLALSACGNGSEASTASGSEASASTTESTETGTSSPTDKAGSSEDVSTTNQKVREACQAAVVEQAAGAAFPTSGSLRAASGADGKQYTVIGTADVAGTPTPYTCSVVAGADGVEVAEVTVG